MNRHRQNRAHSRHVCAHLPFHFRRQRAARTRLSFQANQLSLPDLAGARRPQSQDGRQASAPAPVGVLLMSASAFSLTDVSNSCALIVASFVVVLGLRPLAPLPARECHNKSNFPDILGFARSFHHSPAEPLARLETGRISEWNPRVRLFQASGINSSPVCGPTITRGSAEPSSRSCVMQESDFPGGNHIVPFLLRKKRSFSACQARFEENP